MPFTILVIDEDPQFLETATKLLESDGHWALSASSGENALGMLKTIRPDLILLDYYMPGINGPAVMQKLRADVTTRGIPVVALSAGTAEQANELSRAGCIGFAAFVRADPRLADHIFRRSRYCERCRRGHHLHFQSRRH
jgi:CheY-like chemotaxis protein